MKKKIIQKCFSFLGFFGFVCVLTLGSCGSAPGKANTILRSNGDHLGTVTASASITENRATKEITGDTKNYGYIEDNAPRSKSSAREKIDAAVSPIMEKALANAYYDIIQQVRAKGGNAVTDVISRTNRDFDIETSIETVYVTVTAMAIKAKK